MLKLAQAAVAPAVVAVVECVGGVHELVVIALLAPVDVTQRVARLGVGRQGVGQRAGLVLEDGQQQPRADAVVDGDIIHQVTAVAFRAVDVAVKGLKPSRLATHEVAAVKPHLRRPVDKQAIRQHLERCTPQRLVINWDLHRHPGRHGGGVQRNLRIGFADFAFGGVEMHRQRRQCVAGLGDVFHQFARAVLRPRWQRCGQRHALHRRGWRGRAVFGEGLRRFRRNRATHQGQQENHKHGNPACSRAFHRGCVRVHSTFNGVMLQAYHNRSKSWRRAYSRGREASDSALPQVQAVMVLSPRTIVPS